MTPRCFQQQIFTAHRENSAECKHSAMQSKHLGMTTGTGEKTMEHIVRPTSPTFSSNVAPKRLFPIRCPSHVASADKPEHPLAMHQPMV